MWAFLCFLCGALIVIVVVVVVFHSFIHCCLYRFHSNLLIVHSFAAAVVFFFMVFDDTSDIFSCLFVCSLQINHVCLNLHRPVQLFEVCAANFKFTCSLQNY